MPKEPEIDAGIGAALRLRLAPAIDAHGGVGRFADNAGIPRDTFSKYLSRMQPSASALIKMANASGYSIDYLLGREDGHAESGAPYQASESDHAATPRLDVQALGLPVSAEGDFVAIPFVEADRSADPTLVAIEPAAPDHFLFRREWLASLGVEPENARLLVANGDLMPPTILDGALLLIDRGYGDIVNGKVYLIIAEGIVHVRRVHHWTNGGLILISDDKELQPTETIRRDRVADFKIEARVVWYGRVI